MKFCVENLKWTHTPNKAPPKWAAWSNIDHLKTAPHVSNSMTAFNACKTQIHPSAWRFRKKTNADFGGTHLVSTKGVHRQKYDGQPYIGEHSAHVSNDSHNSARLHITDLKWGWVTWKQRKFLNNEDYCGNTGYYSRLRGRVQARRELSYTCRTLTTTSLRRSGRSQRTAPCPGNGQWLQRPKSESSQCVDKDTNYDNKCISKGPETPRRPELILWRYVKHEKFSTH